MKKFRYVLFLLLGTLSLIYYGVCIAWAWIGVSWLWIWPLFSAFCFIRAIMLKKNVRLPRWIEIIYGVVLCAGLCLFCVLELRIVRAMNAEPADDLDYIITLGAAIRNGEPTGPLLLRIGKATEYLEGNPETILIASGGQGENEAQSEASCIAERVSAAGIDSGRILLEDRSHDTWENIKNSYELIPDGASVGVVTNGFHIYRAMRIAELQGHKVTPVPAKTLLPLGIHYTVREFFGLVKLWLLHEI